MYKFEHKTLPWGIKLPDKQVEYSEDKINVSTLSIGEILRFQTLKTDDVKNALVTREKEYSDDSFMGSKALDMPRRKSSQSTAKCTSCRSGRNASSGLQTTRDEVHGDFDTSDDAKKSYDYLMRHLSPSQILIAKNEECNYHKAIS